MATEALLSFFPSPSHNHPPRPPPPPPPPPTAGESLALCLFSLAADDGYIMSQPIYRCSVCGKSFFSYQALGGHKSSHRRPDMPVRPSRPAGLSVGGSGGSGAHQCSLCFKRFPTGQALGGHKRLHYWETAAVPPLSFISVNVRRFDLNLLPEEEEEGEVESALLKKKIRFSY